MYWPFLPVTTKQLHAGWIFLFICFLFSPSASDARFVPDVRIEHSPPTALVQGERVHLNARVASPEKLKEVRCYFKYEAANPYLFVKMRQTEQGSNVGFRFRRTISIRLNMCSWQWIR